MDKKKNDDTPRKGKPSRENASRHARKGGPVCSFCGKEIGPFEPAVQASDGACLFMS